MTILNTFYICNVNLLFTGPLPFQELNERITKHFEERFLSQKLEVT